MVAFLLRSRFLSIRALLTGLIALLGSKGFGQTQSEAWPNFEVASIHPHDPAVPNSGMRVNPDGITYLRVTVAESFSTAVLSVRYDIVAKAGHNVPDAELRKMLRALLEERFKLRIHREVRELPAYALAKGKKEPKLHRSEGNAESSLRLSTNGAYFGHASMRGLSDFLSGLASVGRPVLDRTGIDEAFDFTLLLSESQPNASGPLDKRVIFEWPSIFSDVQDLGFKLEPTRTRIEMLVVDHAEKPSEN